MAKQSLNGVLQHLRKMAAVQTYQALSDRELLERFVGEHDEAAFTVLIERHGPMVLGVCRRAVPNFHDAEDACQATFLVLARKAASVRKKTSLSSWLHGVACRMAVKLKRDHARRKARESRNEGPVPKDMAAEVTWREMQAILDEELQRIPDHYREPLILCYLECMTRDEAAQHLGLSPGTLHGRLERGRALLREHLTKRGLTLATVMSAAALGESVAQAALAPTFVVSSTKAAMMLAAGEPLTESVVATHVIALNQEILKSMFLTKLKVGTAAVLCASLFVALIGGSFASLGIAQDTNMEVRTRDTSVFTFGQEKAESDADFIRRMSKDLRGTEPTPTEIHFFVVNKDAGRRQKLIDLFIQERQASKAANRQKALADEIMKQRDRLRKLLNLQEDIDRERRKENDVLQRIKKKADPHEDRDEEVKKESDALGKTKKKVDQQKDKADPNGPILGDDPLKAGALRERILKEQAEYSNQKAKRDEKNLIPPLSNELNGVIEKIDPNDTTLLPREPGELLTATPNFGGATKI